MILIGEKLNSSIPKTRAALEPWDESALTALIAAQTDCGADYLDLNTALLGNDETEALIRLVSLCRRTAPSVGIMLDSPNPAVLTAAAKEAVGAELILNSCTADERTDELGRTAAETGASVVVLPICGGKIPAEAAGRIENAGAAIDRLRAFGIPDERIFVDVLVESISAGGDVRQLLSTLDGMRALYPRIRTVCGLSNVSFGLPKRVNLNTALLAMAVSRSLDAVICDVTSQAIRSTLYASLALIGQDEYCMDYVTFIRECGEDGK